MYWIAEIGWNFVGNLDLAKKMIASASASGASAVKFQGWQEGGLKHGPWDLDGRREIYKKAELNAEIYGELKKVASSYSVECFASAFSLENAKWLSQFDDTLKIPSHEAYDLELIEKSSNFFKRLFVSVGALHERELRGVIDLCNSLVKTGKNITLMHCVSSYPCPVELSNLPKLNFILREFSGAVGLSDHSGDTLLPVLASCLGAVCVEKHFTIDRELPGRDNLNALLPEEFKRVVDLEKQVGEALIDRGLGVQAAEMEIVEKYRGRWNASS